MILYLSIIAVCMMLISAIVTMAYNVSFWSTLGITALAVVVVIIVDALIATICRLLPKKCARHDGKLYTVSAKEKKFYEKLKIRKWKDLIPEIGHFTGFRKNKIADPKSVEYVERFLLEACYGELGHFFCLPFGFLILLMFPFMPHTWWAISIPVAIINICLNAPSIFVLRYNSYQLEILRKGNLKKQARENKAQAA